MSDDDDFTNPTDPVDSLKSRMDELVIEHARERAKLAEQVSKLQEENHDLASMIKKLQLEANKIADGQKLNPHPERALGLDFSVPSSLPNSSAKG